ETAHDAFISMSGDGRITYWNARAEQMFGYTRAQAVGMSLAQTIVPPRFRDAHRRGLQRFLDSGVGTILDQPIDLDACRRDGQEFTIDDIPSVRLLRDEPADQLLIRTVHRGSGRSHWNLLKASGLRDDTGELVATVMIIEDITSVKTAELRSRFLADASRRL